jgi:tetratricopeptide (TPR) repeat protein
MTEEKPDYPMGWANLGMLYEQQYDKDNAINAYQKAADSDPNDEYGAKTYAEQRIQSIRSAGSSFSDLTNEELLGTKSKPEEGLPGIIANKSDL